MTREKLLRYGKEYLHDLETACCKIDELHLNFVRESIKALEQEPKTGYWIKYDKEYSTAEKLTPVIHSIRECSECHTRIADFCGEMKYCPNCGAKMESEG